MGGLRDGGLLRAAAGALSRAPRAGHFPCCRRARVRSPGRN